MGTDVGRAESRGEVERAELGQAQVPLVGVRVEGKIRDFASQVVVTQRYVNVEDRPIEAVYVFPLDEGAAVCGFEARVDGKRIVGKVEEREKAFETYDDAVAAGHGAYLLDEERPDVFTASLGNIPPKKEVEVRITTVSELTLEGDDVRFTVPTTVSPRYAPAEDLQGVGQPPAQAVSPPLAWAVPYGLTLSVDVEMSAPLRGVASPSHPVEVELDGARAVVRLSERDAALDRDFVLKLRLAETHQPRARLERGDDGKTYAALSFRPEFATEEAACEVVFVVDRSGSMGGSSIEEARGALQLCLRSLSPGAWFNIVGFGSSYEALFPESRPYDDASLAEASQHVRGLDADLGGTEILPALDFVLKREPRAGLARQVFLLTDGEVSNTEAVIALVRKHSAHTRVFTFGVGYGASHHLVRGVARAGEGAAELIAPGERIEAKVLRQLERALAPALTDVTLDWGGIKVTQAPHRLPPVFAGGRVLVYGELAERAAGAVTLRARGPQGELSFALALDPASVKEDSLVATLWARAMIRDLEEGTSPLHDRRGSLQDRGRGSDRVKKEIVRLGVAYGLASRETSFVAVEERETPVEGEAVLRRVPVMLTRDWGGLDMRRARMGMATMSQVACAPAPPAPSIAFDAMDTCEEVAWDTEPMADADSPARPVRRAPAAAPPRAASAVFDARAKLPRRAERRQLSEPVRECPLDRLVGMQRADGSWELDAELAEVLGRPLRKLQAALKKAKGDPAEAARAWATALALAWLETHAADARDEWSLLAAKAERWLASVAARPASGEDWLELARAAV